MRTHIEKDQYKVGMQPGDYKVIVSKMEVVADMRRRPKNLLPRKYSAVATTNLTATVEPSSENDFEFELEL